MHERSVNEESALLNPPKESIGLRLKRFVQADLSFLKYGLGSVLGNAGQQILLPIYISTYGGTSGVYFILLTSSTFFNLVFIPISIYRYKKGLVDPITFDYMKSLKGLKVPLMGLFNALNGFLIVYSSVLNRTPGPLQAILGQSTILFTLLFSFIFLKKRYTLMQLLGAFFACAGLVISLVPTFLGMHLGSYSFMWPILFMVGMIPGVLMNIIEEDVFRETKAKFDVYWLLSFQSIFQLMFVILLFEVDLIKGFGTSDSVSDFLVVLKEGCECLGTKESTPGTRCHYALLFGFLFAAAYCFSYIYGSFVMVHASANSNAFSTALSPIIVVAFWFIFPKVNAWAGGSPYSHIDIACDVSSLPLLLIGVLIFRYWEKLKDKSSKEEGENEEYSTEYSNTPTHYDQHNTVN